MLDQTGIRDMPLWKLPVSEFVVAAWNPESVASLTDRYVELGPPIIIEIHSTSSALPITPTRILGISLVLGVIVILVMVFKRIARRPQSWFWSTTRTTKNTKTPMLTKVQSVSTIHGHHELDVVHLDALSPVHFASACLGGRISLHKDPIKSSPLLLRSSLAHGFIRCIKLDPITHWLAVALDNGSVELYDDTGTLVCVCRQTTLAAAPVVCMTFTDNSTLQTPSLDTTPASLLWTLDNKGRVGCFGVKESRQLARQNDISSRVVAFTYVDLEGVFVVALEDHRIVKFSTRLDAQRSINYQVMSGAQRSPARITQLSYIQHGIGVSFLVIAFADGRVCIQDWMDGKMILTIEPDRLDHKASSVVAMSVSSGRYPVQHTTIAVARADEMVNVWVIGHAGGCECGLHSYHEAWSTLNGDVALKRLKENSETLSASPVKLQLIRSLTLSQPGGMTVVCQAECVVGVRKCKGRGGWEVWMVHSDRDQVVPSTFPLEQGIATRSLSRRAAAYPLLGWIQGRRGGQIDFNAKHKHANHPQHTSILPFERIHNIAFVDTQNALVEYGNVIKLIHFMIK